jgi:hypothetical protein
MKCVARECSERAADRNANPTSVGGPVPGAATRVAGTCGVPYLDACWQLGAPRHERPVCARGSWLSTDRTWMTERTLTLSETQHAELGGVVSSNAS